MDVHFWFAGSEIPFCELNRRPEERCVLRGGVGLVLLLARDARRGDGVAPLLPHLRPLRPRPPTLARRGVPHLHGGRTLAVGQLDQLHAVPGPAASRGGRGPPGRELHPVRVLVRVPGRSRRHPRHLLLLQVPAVLPAARAPQPGGVADRALAAADGHLVRRALPALDALLQGHGLGVQAAAVREDVRRAVQHPLDVRGRAAAAQPHRRLRVQPGRALPTLLPHRMGSSAGVRVVVGVRDGAGTSHPLLEGLRGLQLRVDTHRTHGGRTRGKQRVLGEHHPDSGDETTPQRLHRDHPSQESGEGDGASVSPARHHAPHVLHQPEGRRQPRGGLHDHQRRAPILAGILRGGALLLHEFRSADGAAQLLPARRAPSQPEPPVPACTQRAPHLHRLPHRAVGGRGGPEPAPGGALPIPPPAPAQGGRRRRLDICSTTRTAISGLSNSIISTFFINRLIHIEIILRSGTLILY